MTRVDKSPEQLSAEAAAPPPDTTLSIARHRALYRAEIPQRLHSARVPSDLEDVAEYVKAAEDWIATGNRTPQLDTGELGGPSLSPQFVAYITEPPRGHLWKGALYALRHLCRTRHPDHTGPVAWRGSLCHRLVQLVVVGEYTFPQACARLGLDERRSARTLVSVLRFMDEHMEDRRKAELASREREEQRAQQVGAAQGAYRHHVPSPEHVAECPNPECRARREAA